MHILLITLNMQDLMSKGALPSSVLDTLLVDDELLTCLEGVDVTHTSSFPSIPSWTVTSSMTASWLFSVVSATEVSSRMKTNKVGIYGIDLSSFSASILYYLDSFFKIKSGI